MDDKSETELDDTFRGILDAPVWLTIWRFTVPVFFMLGLMLFVYRSTSQGISDEEIGLRALTIAAPSLIFFLIFERTIGRRAVEEFRAGKGRTRTIEAPSEILDSGSSPIVSPQKILRRGLVSSILILVFGPLVTILAAVTGSLLWFPLLLLIPLRRIPAEWRAWRRNEGPNPFKYPDTIEPLREDYFLANMRQLYANRVAASIGCMGIFARFAMFALGIFLIGYLVLETENNLWTLLFWPLVGLLTVVGTLFDYWAAQNRSN